MSLIVFDFRCVSCAHYETDKLVSKGAVETQRCPKCDSPLVPLPPATRTNFKFADSRLKF